MSAESPILREARAAVFAALCVLVGAVGHDAFSPTDVPVWALAASAAVLFVAIRPLTKRERGLPSILAAMAVVQLGLHQAFSSAQHHGGSMQMQMTAMAHADGLPPIGTWWCGPKAPAGMADMVMYHAAGMQPPAVHSMTFGMLASHVAASLVASWWLRRGEAAVWALARSLSLLLTVPLRLLVTALVPWTPAKRVRTDFDTADRLGPGRLIRFAVARRGPPAGAFAFC
jgi:hypothetical protein